MFQTAFNPLNPKNQYFTPPSCARSRTTRRQLFSQRPKGNPMKLQRIPALRHKLRVAGIADEPIRTHHGLGYSFNET